MHGAARAGARAAGRAARAGPRASRDIGALRSGPTRVRVRLDGVRDCACMLREHHVYSQCSWSVVSPFICTSLPLQAAAYMQPLKISVSTSFAPHHALEVKSQSSGHDGDDFKTVNFFVVCEVSLL